MNGIEEVARRFVKILCNDFGVDVIPNVIHIKLHIGLSGSYYAKTYSITISRLDYRTIIHEFIHHLQYERIGYNYDEFVRECLRESKKQYWLRESEIEARVMSSTLYDIYRPVFKNIFRAKPLGSERLCRELVMAIHDQMKLVDRRIKEGYMGSVDWHAFNIDFISDYYSNIKYILRYAIRACFRQWEIPESEEMFRQIRLIRTLSKRYSTILKSKIELPGVEEQYKHRIESMYNRLKSLHEEFRDMLSRVFPEYHIL